MNVTDDLTGTQVVVNPNLSDDPVNKQGQSGTITFADPGADDFFVSFGKEQGLYASDALLVFRNPNDIYADLMANTKKLDKQEIKDLYRIGMLLDSGQSRDQKAALEMVLANPKVREYTLMSLEQKLGPLIGATEDQQQEMTAARGR